MPPLSKTPPTTPNPPAPVASSATPVYVPWKSFAAYLGSLKGTTVPHTLDNSVRPASMAGGLWRQLTSALQFLGLIDDQKVVKDAMGKLVKAHGTSEWKDAVRGQVLPAYTKIVKDLPIDRASTAQLEKAFKDHGGVSGQMGEKCIRFYLHALKEADVKYSSLLGMRRDKGATKKLIGVKRKKTKESPSLDATKNGGSHYDEEEDPDRDVDPIGTISLPLHFKGKPKGLIRVASKMDAEDWKVFDLTAKLIRMYAEQGAVD